MPDQIATLAEFAKILRCKRSYVTQLKKDGRIVLDGDGRVLVQASLARIEATCDPGKVGVAARHAAARGAPLASDVPPPSDDDLPEDEPPAPDPHSAGFQHWRQRNERAKALQGERENALAEGKLMRADEVERAVVNAVTTLRTRLETLPDILAPQVTAINDEARNRDLLATEISHALEECARQFAAAGKST